MACLGFFILCTIALAVSRSHHGPPDVHSRILRQLEHLLGRVHKHPLGICRCVWNAMIGAYAQFGHMPDALELLREMLQCEASPARRSLVGELREVLDLIVSMPFKTDFPAWSALIYGKCGITSDAKRAKSVLLWSTMKTILSIILLRALNFPTPQPPRESIVAQIHANGCSSRVASHPFCPAHEKPCIVLVCMLADSMKPSNV
ncbi:hypothetical protein SELMODRAFT_419920 [Selaginella moellendorffii]|uniref:Pentatricopeptide repeat-containing protein n=1 Tax=Selaginella moellendorffii TaxID=88036 RepID=D8SA04_SELML|nr:hypothetical protein SELMODRAFT_419920 [Selaginella moellendorffii]